MPPPAPQIAPTVIIDSYRTDALAGILQPVLGDCYISVGRNLRVPGLRLVAVHTQRLSVLEGAVFVARDEKGTLIDQIVSDGKTRKLPTRLEAGEYGLRFEGKGPAWFVPERLDPGLLAEDPRPADPFDGVYG